MTVSYQGNPCYDIVFSESFDGLSEEIPERMRGRKACIVTDSQVAPLYVSPVKAALEGVFGVCEVFSFPAGEGSKTLDTVQKLYTFLIEHHFDRKDVLIALGGGVTGDLTGFAAATYLRGIDFIQIPTTLLAQVDSSIGGKTGVDFDSYKNMVGAFHMPSLVYINPDTLQTLEPRQFYNGFAEVMKHGLIRDSRYYEWLIRDMYEICARDPETLMKMIKRSCEIKREIVEKDPEEKGERALLNFGHTIGHAFESFALKTNHPVLHGYAVAWGMVCELYLSHIRCGFPKEALRTTIQFIKENYGSLYFTCDDYECLYDFMKHDKKNASCGVINFTLLGEIGDIRINQTASQEEIYELLDFYRETMGC